MIFYEEEGASGGSTETVAPSTNTDLSGISEATETDGLPPSKAQPRATDDDDVAPDFSFLGLKKPVKEPAEQPESGRATAKHQKRAGEAPEPKKQPSREATKAVEPAKKPEEAPKPAKKVEKALAKPKVELREPLPAIPEDDKDLDEIKAKPNVHPQVAKSIADIREIAKRERATARAYRAEVEAAKKEAETLKGQVGKLPKEVEEELNGLRNFNLLFRAEQDPRFKAEFDEKVGAVEEKIIKMLESHNLDAKHIEAIREAAKAGDMERWPRWAELVKLYEDPMDQKELLDARAERKNLLGARAARLTDLAGSKEKFMEAVQNRDSEERKKFAQEIEKVGIDLAAKNDWIVEEGVPEDATAEQKTVIEERNAKVQERAKAFGEHVRASYDRDPEKIAQVALNAVKVDYLEELNEELTTERDKAVARVKELEARAVKVRDHGRMGYESAPIAKAIDRVSESDAGIGGDGESAIGRFFKRKASV